LENHFHEHYKAPRSQMQATMWWGLHSN